MGIKNDFRQGAKLETGGLPERGNGWYWKPTVPTKVIEDPALAQFAGPVSDSGEGRWTIKAAIDEVVPAHVLSPALYSRFHSASMPISSKSQDQPQLR